VSGRLARERQLLHPLRAGPMRKSQTRPSERRPADRGHIVRWVDICRTLRMFGHTEDYSKAECFRANFSQLPVMTGERDVKGVISWLSIGRGLTLAGKRIESEVRECMDAARIISADASLFDAIDTIVRDQYDRRSRIRYSVCSSERLWSDCSTTILNF